MASTPTKDKFSTAYKSSHTRAIFFIQRTAQFDELYRWQQENLPAMQILYPCMMDGRHANGEPHMGHALNKILKDVINLYKFMKGHRVHYRPGWDCHGLPIELKACKKMAKNQTVMQIRETAGVFARETMEKQAKEFRRWVVIGDWGNPYVTMDREYEANQLKVFYEMYKKGCIYRDFKPVYWSPSSHTALAEAELEYKEHHSRSVYVLFPTRLPPALSQYVWGRLDIHRATVVFLLTLCSASARAV